MFAEGSVSDYPLTIRHREGRVTDVLYNASVYRDSAGNVAGVFAAARDITAVRELREQRSIAGALQSALLDIPGPVKGVQFGHLYRSATEAARVGGDFYDVFEVKDGRIAVMIGDVAGHGVAAARTATLVKDVVHAFTHQTISPEKVLGATNQLLTDKHMPGFVTLFLGILEVDTGRFRYASAGHPDTLLRRTSAEVLRLGMGSLPLGVYPDETWKAHEAAVERGDMLIMYTDGVIEARRDGELFGEARLGDLVAGAEAAVADLPRFIVDRVLDFSGGELRDDLALLVVSRDTTAAM